MVTAITDVTCLHFIPTLLPFGEERALFFYPFPSKTIKVASRDHTYRRYDNNPEEMECDGEHNRSYEIYVGSVLGGCLSIDGTMRPLIALVTSVEVPLRSTFKQNLFQPL